MEGSITRPHTPIIRRFETEHRVSLRPSTVALLNEFPRILDLFAQELDQFREELGEALASGDLSTDDHNAIMISQLSVLLYMHKAKKILKELQRALPLRKR